MVRGGHHFDSPWFLQFALLNSLCPISLSLPIKWSTIEGLLDTLRPDFQGNEHHESNVTSSSQDIIQGGGLEQSTPLYSTSVGDGLCIPVAEEEFLSRTKAYENAGQWSLSQLGCPVLWLTW